MDIKRAVLVGGAVVVVCAICGQIFKHPGDKEGHIHQETPQLPEQVLRPVAVTSVTSSSTLSDRPRWIKSM